MALGPKLQCLPKVKEDLGKVLIFQDTINQNSFIFSVVATSTASIQAIYLAF